MAKDLNNILLSEIEENKIKEKTPDKLPLNPTASGWSGQEVRRFLAKSLIDNEGSFLAEFKKKMTEIKTQFEDVFGDGDGNIQGQIDSIIQNIDEIELTASTLATTVLNNYNNLNAIKVNKTLTILGIDLEDNITLEEFKTALGDATIFTNGLMSALDKQNLAQTMLDIQSLFSDKADTTALAITDQNIANLQNDKVNKTQTIMDLDLQDNITRTEVVNAIGEATQILSGLMSITDKQRLDALHAMLGVTPDADNVVNTINEIMEIFATYPEGADILTALNGKADKVAEKQLSTNDLTDALKNNYDVAYTHSQIKSANPHEVKFSELLQKPTTKDGYGITDVYKKLETYTRLEINNLLNNLSAVKGLKSTLLTPTELSNGDTISTNLLTNNGAFVVFTATNTSTGEIDSDTVPVSTIVTGKKFVFFDNQEIVFTIGETNSTFETSEDVTLKINLLYLDSENTQAISVDFDGSLTNYLENQENLHSAIIKLDEELKTTNDNSSNHITDMDNPHGVTATQVGLGNVDDTSDLDKPISTLTQNALNDKSNVGHTHDKSDITDFSHTHVKEDITDFAHNHDDRYYTEEETDTLLNAKLNTSLKGAVNGIAELGSDGKVPSSQLPSYVDDVIEASAIQGFPLTGEAGKIYVSLDTNKTYRWSGSGYTEISSSLALGETSSTAGRGDWTKTAYDHTSLTNNPHSVTKAQVGLSNVDNTSDLDKPISTAQQTSLDNKVDKVEGKGLSTEDYTTTEKNKLSGIKAGAEVNVQSDWTQEVNTADDYIKNKPSIPTVPTISNDIILDKTSTTKTASPKAVYEYVTDILGDLASLLALI